MSSIRHSTAIESREAIIRFGNSGLKTEERILDAFKRFKADGKYTLNGDALNVLIERALIVSGYLPATDRRVVTDSYAKRFEAMEYLIRFIEAEREREAEAV